MDVLELTYPQGYPQKIVLEDSYPQPRTRVSAEPPPPENVVSVVVMCVYLVCLAGSSGSVSGFLLPPSQARLPSGVCVGLCGVFCVCVGFVLFVCCVALCVWFRRRFEMCELVVLFSRASERSECGSPTERSEGGSENLCWLFVGFEWEVVRPPVWLPHSDSRPMLLGSHML
jgi:hypothetical protein